MDEPTPWEDINPTTVSVQRQGQQSLSSVRPETEPRIVFRNELTACLALVAPAGMTEEARGDWLAVAWQTLSHIPPDILAIGCKAARQKCDHPAKIVPTIIAETKEALTWRRTVQEAERTINAPRLAKEICTGEEAAQILREVGIAKRVHGGR